MKNTMPAGNRRHTDVVRTYFRKLLLKQQERFRLFLDILEKQKNAIKQGRIEAVTVYAELEERVFMEIRTLQKAADTWDTLYRRAPAEHDGIAELQTALDALLKDVRRKTEENQRLLSRRMSRIASDIQAIKKHPLRKPDAVYTGTVNLTV